MRSEPVSPFLTSSASSSLSDSKEISWGDSLGSASMPASASLIAKMSESTHADASLIVTNGSRISALQGSQGLPGQRRVIVAKPHAKVIITAM
tara:strand:+ start:777 stop:1055 length:279 start_codon:yes stop_codon:yes gene_type:complete